MTRDREERDRYGRDRHRRDDPRWERHWTDYVGREPPWTEGGDWDEPDRYRRDRDRWDDPRSERHWTDYVGRWPQWMEDEFEHRRRIERHRDRARDRRGYADRDYGAGREWDSRRRYGADYGRETYGREDRGRDPEGRGFLDRAGDEIASWFGDEDAERRRRMDQGHRGRGPKGYTRSDDRITEDVNDLLSDDWRLDASDIEVTVSSREVTLSGTVSDRAAKRRAEDLAESVSGVEHVQNNLRCTSRSGTNEPSGMPTTPATGPSRTGSGGR